MNTAASEPIRKGGAARPLLVAYILFLGAFYLLQARSPLRLNTDSYRLLSMAVSAYQGNGYLVDGNADQFPVGYPLVVRALMQAGLGTSMVLVLFNLFFLMGGLWAFCRWYSVQEESVSAALPVAFVLSSWVMIKHVTLPLTDLLYFGLSWLSLLCLWLFYRGTGRHKWQWLILSFILAYLALQCRSVGLAIVPVLAVTALLHRENHRFLRRFARDWKAALASLSAMALLLVCALVITLKTGWYESQFVRDGSYFQSLLDSAEDTGILSVLLQNMRYRLLELGEIFTNLPHSKFPWLLPVLYLAGLATCLVLVRGAWLLSRRHDSLPLLLYSVIYSTLMFLWPYYDARFWLALLPLMAVMLFRTLEDLQNRWPTMRFASRSYIACFFLLGLAALAFSTRISLSGSEFSELYGDGSTTMTYRYAFQNGKAVDRGRVHDGYVRILQIFEPLASSDQAPWTGSPGVDLVLNHGSLAVCPRCLGALESHDRAVHRLPDRRKHARSRVVRDARGLGRVLAEMGERQQVVAASPLIASTTPGVPGAPGNP
jgi:hypothetical protein